MKNTKDKNTIAPEAIEFQSDALELENKRLPWFGRFGTAFIALFILVVIIWASVCKVDTVVEANGKLISVTPNITLKPLERTVIKKINVKVGQLVKKNQILITFDPTFNQAEKERLEEQLHSIEAQYDRLNAEAQAKDYPGKQLSHITLEMRSQVAIFRKRAIFRQQKLLYFTQNMNRIKASIHSNQASYVKLYA